MLDASKDKKLKKAAKTGTVEMADEGSAIKDNEKKEEETTMEKTMKIEGMMCGHCEAAVKKALH